MQLSAEEAADLEMLRTGGQEARGEFFERYRSQLQNIVRFRMDPRLRRRVSDSDIIQQASLTYVNEIEQYLYAPSLPPKVWLRKLMRRVIWRVNRHHFETQARDLRRERDLDTRSHVNIQQLSASLSSAGKKMDRKQLQKRMRELVAKMPKLEREILTLVHFEEQSIREAALELGINYEAAKKRYLRSLKRMKVAHEGTLQHYVR
ncbi:MAG: sigma-70 family RNA polymerase sigma factor [Pirellulaceae bacterium]